MKIAKVKNHVVAHATAGQVKDVNHHFASREEVAKKAYELYEANGCVPNRDLDNWLEAERIVTAAKKS